MPRIAIKTKVNEEYKQVFAAFDKDLFLKLNPPFPPVKLIRFDGCKKEDFVTLSLNCIFFKQEWTSQITENGQNEKEIWFVDEGIKLPFFLKKWKHRHRILRQKSGTVIIDDILYLSPYILLSYLLYPVLYPQFLYRKPIYRKIFQ